MLSADSSVRVAVEMPGSARYTAMHVSARCFLCTGSSSGTGTGPTLSSKLRCIEGQVALAAMTLLGSVFVSSIPALIVVVSSLWKKIIKWEPVFKLPTRREKARDNTVRGIRIILLDQDGATSESCVFISLPLS